MSSLVEMMGAAAQWAFVPGDVIKNQAATQADLQARADDLNSRYPEVIARAQASGMLTETQARQSMQSMNSALFLSGNRERELGEQVITDIKDAAANAPNVLAESVHGGINKIGATIWKAVPWWIWALIAGYIGLQVFLIVRPLRAK